MKLSTKKPTCCHLILLGVFSVCVRTMQVASNRIKTVSRLQVFGVPTRAQPYQCISFFPCSTALPQHSIYQPNIFNNTFLKKTLNCEFLIFCKKKNGSAVFGVFGLGKPACYNVVLKGEKSCFNMPLLLLLLVSL